MKRIGVSSCFVYPDPNRSVFGPKYLCYLEKDMANYLSRPGVMPILIPDLSPDALVPFMDELDGLVLHGGTDVAPQTYGADPIENGRWPGDPYRDQYELNVLRLAMERDFPVFGICRGFQLLNAYFGGTLYQDTIVQGGTVNEHRDAKIYDQMNHEIVLVPDGLLSELHANESNRTVNSIHHQATDRLGNDLEVLAHSYDGLVEAFMWTKAPKGKVFGVQWHPEFFHNSTTPLMDPEPIYSHFLSFCD